MHLPHVISCGVYRNAQTYRQVCQFSGLSLSISGRLRTTQYYCDGQMKLDLRSDSPSLHFIRLGEVSDFDYGVDRENWVLMFDEPFPEYDPSVPGYFLRDLSFGRIDLPAYLPVPQEDVPALRSQFTEIQSRVQSSLPGDRLMADLLSAALVSRFLSPSHPADRSSPARKFRALIDDDANWDSSLEDLCRRCGYHHDYLRQEFLHTYGLTPGQYRQERRLKRILHLFTYTQLSLKEVAYAVGMKNVTHLNYLLRKELGKTPTEICRTYRQE